MRTNKLAAELDRFSGDTKLAQALLERINARITHHINLMEVCGTHTVAISSSGVRRALDPRLKLLSGPGCPVCVTDQQDIDAAIELARVPGVMLTTFGDMMRVPGSYATLELESAHGADVRVVYSPLDAVKLAQENLDREVAFLGVGFETTAPTVAAAVKIARSARVRNFSVLPLFKTMPNALRLIACAPQLKVDGFILPGHVSTIIGAKPYQFLATEFRKPCCIVGFEVLDLLQGILMLLDQLSPDLVPGALCPMPGLPSPSVSIQYKRSVTVQGNLTAQNLLAEVFRPTDATWRGLGMIKGSGLGLQGEFRQFDARGRFTITTRPVKMNPACRCGDVLMGAISPTQCRMFGKVCTPEKPLGPCMVSSEGACAAYYKYER